MARLTLVFAALLIALGVGLFLATGSEQPTALIPAGLGVVMAVCGWLARDERMRMHAMHAAVLLALIGFGGAVPGVAGALADLRGEAVERPTAAWGRTAMAALCLVYVALGVRSFVAARRARKAREST